ncbi:MAG: type II toxin-antitoxin system RelE/ParE family toxin [Terriglobales bacterium]
MALRWTSKARSDLARLYEFLQPVHPPAAIRAVRSLVAAAKRIPHRPRLGVRLHEFGEREVRRLIVGDYEIRYELTATDVYVLRIFHTREDR